MGRVKNITQIEANRYAVITCYYDGLGRVTSLKEGNFTTSTYQYFPSQVLQITYGAFGANDTVSYNLNVQGLATSDNIGDSMAYDNMGEQIYKSYGSSATIYTWANGDITLETSNGSSVIPLYHTALESRNFGMPEFGKMCKHLAYYPGHSFGFDAQGRVSADTATSTLNGTMITLYSYY